ncbi:hypothetical protein J2X76_001157 [Neorhizobium sp. 2083]|uniref:hypothetical protein n=1 Tax=Neorhizobium sp. 2083 TaxID=2817762 RepID=UPI0013AFDC4B|nr:hypothetical protein [Neorhizobium sp. 2083]MDR6816003.1 hypothetical protein [Neorhizobium sp. 2083]
MNALTLIVSRPNFFHLLHPGAEPDYVDKNRPFPENANFRTATDGYQENGRVDPVAKGKSLLAVVHLTVTGSPLK